VVVLSVAVILPAVYCLSMRDESDAGGCDHNSNDDDDRTRRRPAYLTGRYAVYGIV
jgi:hypothetical protein